MSHPYHHAVSRARTWGGDPAEYVAIESWFDQSKAFTADARHRLLLHHSYGVFLAERRFGVTIVNSAGRTVPVRLIGEAHCKEDFNRPVPSLTECFEAGLTGEKTTPALTALKGAYLRAFDAGLSVGAHCDASARAFGGPAGAYEALHAFFDEPRSHLACPASLLALHHTFGVHLAVQLFGHSLPGGASTRRVAEARLRLDLGLVPAVDTALKLVPAQAWMNTRALPLSRTGAA